MKYKCIAKCFVEDTLIMSPGDIIAISGTQFYNVTTGVDYHNVPDISQIKECLEAITDEIGAVPNVKQEPKGIPVIPVYTDADRFKDITKRMTDIFRRKNHDYGNSFELSLDDEGLAAARIRMGDKWNRFKNLSKMTMGEDKPQVRDESLRDTLLDLANYAIMTVIWMDKNLKTCDSGKH